MRRSHCARNRDDMADHAGHAMHWLAYRIEGDRVVWLRIIRSNERPPDVDVINNGFHDEQEALALMANYLRTNDAGFLTVPRERAEKHITRLERIRLAYRIESFLLWGVIGAYGAAVILLGLLILHVIAGG